MHDWRNFNNVSFESIIVILYDEGMTTVIHPGTWSQHPFVSGVCFFFFFWDALEIGVSKGVCKGVLIMGIETCFYSWER